MLENSLKTREKFINKLKGKIDSMIESVSLLQKVDKKLLKVGVQNGGARLNNFRMTPMRGGAPGANYDFADVEKAALRKKAQILMQQKNIAELDKKLKSLTADFEPVQIALENVKELINSIKVSFPENILDGVVPNFSELPIVWQYNALHDVKFAELSSFNPGINKLQPNIVAFDVAPGASGSPTVPITDQEKNEMIAYAKKFDVTAYPDGTTFDKLEALYNTTKDDIHERTQGSAPSPAVTSPAVTNPAVTNPVVPNPGVPSPTVAPAVASTVPLPPIDPGTPKAQKYRFY
jgi:hypothetical protein